MDKRRVLLRVVKVFHTVVWFTVEGCTLYVLVAGIRKRSDRRAGASAAVVAADTLIFAGNGFHCPLTSVACDLGDETGSVTIYLPQWLTRTFRPSTSR